MQNLDPTVEIIRKVGAAKTTIEKLSVLLCDKSLNLKIRQAQARCTTNSTVRRRSVDVQH